MKNQENYPLAVKEIQKSLLEFGVSPIINKYSWSEYYTIKFDYKGYSYSSTITWVDEPMNSTKHGSFRRQKQGERDSLTTVRNIVKNLKKM